jgi:uncharacterized integral membrane protein
MWRTVLIIAVVLIIFLFISVNMHTTQVNLPFGKGFEIRTVLLLVLSFLLGYGTAYFVGIIKNSKNRRK